MILIGVGIGLFIMSAGISLWKLFTADIFDMGLGLEAYAGCVTGIFGGLLSIILVLIGIIIKNN